MATQKVVAVNAGQYIEVTPNITSAGAGDSGKLIALNAAGAIDITAMPAGIGGNVQTMTASEAIAAGAAINVASSGQVRNANATDATKPCHGFSTGSISSAATGPIVLGSGINTSSSSLTAGAPVYLATTSGAVTATAPAATGNLLQQVGFALSATSYVLNVNGAGITRA